MKLLFVLFSLYVLTLSAVPCCGEDACCKDGIGAMEQHDDEPHQELPCSPFFSCSTCHIVLVPNCEFVSVVKVATTDVGSFYPETFLPGYHPPVWQPPRNLCLTGS